MLAGVLAESRLRERVGGERGGEVAPGLHAAGSPCSSPCCSARQWAGAHPCAGAGARLGKEAVRGGGVDAGSLPGARVPPRCKCSREQLGAGLLCGDQWDSGPVPSTGLAQVMGRRGGGAGNLGRLDVAWLPGVCLVYDANVSTERPHSQTGAKWLPRRRIERLSKSRKINF